ncbi:zinc ABC transporter substrate-binding protein [Achromobacter insuavis]
MPSQSRAVAAAAPSAPRSPRGFALTLAAFCLPAQAAEKFKVVTTFTVIADMARNVAGDAATVESVTRPGPKSMNTSRRRATWRAQGAQLILWNGLNLEQWFERFFHRLKNVPGVVVTRGIEPIGIGDGPYEGKPNPHAWMSPANALIYVDNIRDALVQYDPANAETYRANAAAYKARIQEAIGPAPAPAGHSPSGAGWRPARARSATWRGISTCASCISGRSTPINRARRSRFAAWWT